MSFKKVLVLAPHTDDGELGAGGFISKLIEDGADVYYMAFSTAEESVPEGFPKDILKTEVRAATKVLGVKDENVIIFNYQVRKLNYARQEILEELIKFKRVHQDIDLVLLPSINDIHQDHSTIANEGIRAFKTKSIFSYELIWNNLSFNTQSYISLEEKHINKKIDALKEYKSQGFRDYLSADFIRSLAVARGVQFGVKYAETFEVVRLSIK
ncbi:LmbE family N-acetylglucosaminyl deacetylase [Chryseobacterium sp. 52]|uniref:PIG-L deacetylase family protein n=1 Tax=Chryseobacterium sp. 52 TaxID=2035213 RepID=UPI000C19F809|nr:PIG-L deacetylase family protein [Chryseobacterium sp. 52]PIF47088.1 LmbE family N-acetylglucosaminyl deacetylase [Chryseobacterium sp. 52]